MHSFLVLMTVSLLSLDFTRTFLTASIPFIYKLSIDKNFIQSFKNIFSNSWIYFLGFLQLQKRPDGLIVDSSWKIRFPEQFENIINFLYELIRGLGHQITP